MHPPSSLPHRSTPERAALPCLPARLRLIRHHGHAPARSPMFDVIYLLIGAVFLGGCVLYAIACEHL